MFPISRKAQSNYGFSWEANFSIFTASSNLLNLERALPLRRKVSGLRLLMAMALSQQSTAFLKSQRMKWKLPRIKNARQLYFSGGMCAFISFSTSSSFFIRISSSHFVRVTFMFSGVNFCDTLKLLIAVNSFPRRLLRHPAFSSQSSLILGLETMHLLSYLIAYQICFPSMHFLALAQLCCALGSERVLRLEALAVAIVSQMEMIGLETAKSLKGKGWQNSLKMGSSMKCQVWSMMWRRLVFRNSTFQRKISFSLEDSPSRQNCYILAQISIRIGFGTFSQFLSFSRSIIAISSGKFFSSWKNDLFPTIFSMFLLVCSKMSLIFIANLRRYSRTCSTNLSFRQQQPLLSPLEQRQAYIYSSKVLTLRYRAIL